MAVKPVHSSYFDLNIEKVLEDWGVHHALREVIANALDEQHLTETGDIQIFKDQFSVWHVRDFGRGLTYQHLTQNENQEKLQKASLVIGKFGVGLKDALATFDRNRVELVIKSRHGDITIAKATKHSFEQLVTLHAVINPPSDPAMVGTEFLFKNVRDEDVQEAKKLFLQFSDEQVLEKTEFGEVILNPRGKSRIFINGLKVAEEENFLFSYNITSLTAAMRKALNRERSDVGRTAYTPRVKAILLACKTNQVAQPLMADLQEYASGRMHDELKWVEISAHASRILSSASKKVMFMTSEQLVSAPSMRDEAQREGQQIIVVSDRVAERISGLSDLSGAPIRDLRQYIEERHQSFQFTFIKHTDLSEQEKQVFDCTDRIFSLIGGRPQNVMEVLISETMRPGDYDHTLGLWNGRQIIILRSQLLNLESYAATLLHEASHALSRASDITREFEGQLTALLGRVAVRALHPLNQDAPSEAEQKEIEILDDEPVPERPTKKPRISSSEKDQ